MNANVMILVITSMISVATFATEEAYPRFVTAVDKCEAMWRDGKYDQLYNYIGELDQKYQDYLPARLLFAIREVVFGAQYETGAAVLTDLTNQVRRVICEINPELHQRIIEMIRHMNEEAEFCLEDSEDMEYRRKNEDPRTQRRTKPVGLFWPLVFMDVPLCGSDVSLREPIRWGDSLVKRHHDKPLAYFDLGMSLFKEMFCFNAKSNTVVTYCRKKALLDDYVFGFTANAGVRGLIEKLNDGFVQMDGNYALAILRQQGDETKVALMEYLSRKDMSIEADEGKRMAVWALLQFAHDDPEVADYLRHLPPKIDKRCSKTSEYLGLAIKHLDEGCNRHFLEKYVGGSKNAEESKTLDRESERKN